MSLTVELHPDFLMTQLLPLAAALRADPHSDEAAVFVRRTGMCAADFFEKANDPEYGHPWVVKMVQAYLNLQPQPQLAELSERLDACQGLIEPHLKQEVITALDKCYEIIAGMEPYFSIKVMIDGDKELQSFLAVISDTLDKTKGLAIKPLAPAALAELIETIQCCFTEVQGTLEDDIELRASVPLRECLIFQNYEFMEQMGLGEPPKSYLTQQLKDLHHKLNMAEADFSDHLQSLDVGTLDYFEGASLPVAVWAIAGFETNDFGRETEGYVRELKVTGYMPTKNGTATSAIITCTTEGRQPFSCAVESVFLSEAAAQAFARQTISEATKTSLESDLARFCKAFLPKIIGHLES